MNTPDEVRAIAETMAAGTSDSQENLGALLLGGAAINLAIIADAVTKLVEKNPDPLKPVSLRDLSPEERTVVEALRAGDLLVVPGDNVATVEGTFPVDR